MFLDMQEYPPFSEPGMNNGLLYSDAEYIETQSFSCLNKRAALKSLATQKGHFIASEDAATREIEQMDEARTIFRAASSIWASTTTAWRSSAIRWNR